MTNGGITEGHTEYSGCSDLSPVTFFGGGETRMQMREALGGVKGPLGVLRHPAPIYFMIKYLALLVVGASVSYGQQFNGTIYDLNSGRVQVLNGNITQPNNPRDESIAILRRLNAELEVSLANQRQEYELRQQTYELQRQTRLLQEIADK